MKRYISFFMILSLCFSFAACSVKDDSSEVSHQPPQTVTTTVPKPIIEAAEHSRDFTDENGRVVYTLKAFLPQITGNAAENTASYINKFSYGLFEEACEFALSNIENAANFMDSQGNGKPWSRMLDFDISYSDGRFLSIVVKDYFSMFGSEEIEPTLTGYTFDIISGMPCTILDFTYENYSINEIERVVEEDFLFETVSDYFFNGTPLTDEQKQTVRDVFDTSNFYLIENGIMFYFSGYEISPMHHGTFTVDYTWDEIALILKMPK
ncbi:MAG: DUF3298 domain-containing protein [Clostridia bacterium]|nr:DUF3298 domain-containing protein [Clostridia bacterium]